MACIFSMISRFLIHHLTAWTRVPDMGDAEREEVRVYMDDLNRHRGWT